MEIAERELVTIRYCSSAHEYQARNSSGKVVGTCVFLKEHGDSGLWKAAVPGLGAWTKADREEALRVLHTKSLEHCVSVAAA